MLNTNGRIYGKYTMKEREIRIIDIIMEVFMHWRLIIVWMIIGGALIGGISFINASRNSRTQQIKQEQLASQLEIINKQLEENNLENTSSYLVEKEYFRSQLTEEEQNYVNMVLKAEDYLNALTNYADNSILMQIDGKKAPYTYLTFLVKASNTEQSGIIEMLYEDIVINGFEQWYTENVEEKDAETGITELITVEKSPKSELRGSSSFSVHIVHISEEKCAILADDFISYVNILQKQIEKIAGSHTIDLVNRTFVFKNNMELISSQYSTRKEITDNITNLNKLKNAFDDSERKYYQIIKSEKKESSNIKQYQSVILDNLQTTRPSINIKYVLLGMLVFGFLVGAYIFMKYIMNKRIQIYDDLGEMYGIPMLARIPTDESKKKLFAFIDRFIMKLFNRNKRIFSSAQAIELAAIAVKIQIKKIQMDTVYCVGCDFENCSHKIIEQLKISLNKEGISLKVLNNILYDHESMNQLQEAKAVFLMETVNDSLYDEITQELDLLKRQEINTLGIIVVE